MKKAIRSFCVFLSILVLLASLPFSAIAAKTNAEIIEKTQVLKTLDGNEIGVELQTLNILNEKSKNTTKVTIVDIRKYTLSPGMENYREIYKDKQTTTVFEKKQDGNYYVNGKLNTLTLTKEQFQKFAGTSPSNGGMSTMEFGGTRASCYYDNYESSPGGTYYAACYEHFDSDGVAGDNISKYFASTNTYASDYKMYANAFANDIDDLNAACVAAAIALGLAIPSIFNPIALIVELIAGGAIGYDVYSALNNADNDINRAYNTLLVM